MYRYGFLISRTSRLTGFSSGQISTVAKFQGQHLEQCHKIILMNGFKEVKISRRAQSSGSDIENRKK